jgi:hypothetical protein
MAIKRPTEARAGVVSGRIVMVLTISLIGACAALGIAWLMLAAH